ncbi:geranylgeranyl diphosphate reductase, chloroplastic [Lactuca sativa]|uniref:Geranylgeranyl diphosphate reductase, chloroplastic n=1 Tax=Lactuca sativa TaxID=4236 RepID=A0A9R1XMA7_LACSA|nr:geranylgeranyl diphosphate reductase, chloroplastic [Lactuca sativa]KAJ0212687.1 hypothetical protein LSAT_V11C400199970 [Lactuca sativa]
MASITFSFIGLHQSSMEIHHHHSITTPSKCLVPSQLHYRRLNVVAAMSSPTITGRNLRVAVVGGGPAGGAAAETLAKGGIETFLIERKLDNAKPCGGSIPLCMVEEFDLPMDIIDRRVTNLKIISPSNVSVTIGKTLKPHEYIGMVRREVLDAYLRDRAVASGATIINGLFVKMDKPQEKNAPYVLHYNTYNGKTPGERTSIEVDAVIGADGANSRVAKSIDAGDYEYLIAIQERIKIPDNKMKYYLNLAEMYVGSDISPDFYGWVYPKSDHVDVGTGTLRHKPDIEKLQLATRLRVGEKIQGGKIIRVEAHPMPQHPRPRRVVERVALVGDAAGYVMKGSGEGIYFAAKSGRMCAEAIVEGSENGRKMVDEGDLRSYLEKWDTIFGPTFKKMDMVDKVFYRSNMGKEAVVELFRHEYAQKMILESYLYKTVATVNPLERLKLAVSSIGSLVRANN